MKTKATKEQIAKVLEGVKKERNILPEYSMFGDNNWEGMDKRIRLLERGLEGIYPTVDIDNDDTYYCAEWMNDINSSEFGDDYS